MPPDDDVLAPACPRALTLSLLPRRGGERTADLDRARECCPRSGIPPLISAVTLAELTVGPLVAANARERVARQAHLQQAEADFDPLPFDSAAARSFGQVTASLRRAGRKPAARAYDAMIAATAIANGLAVHTCNPGDFAGTDGLDVIAVPHPHH